MLDRLHLGDGRDRAFEILDRDAAAGGDLHAEKDGHPEAELREVEIGAAAADGARLLQPFHPAPGGGLGQADLPAEGARAGARVLGHEAEELPVGFVKRDHIGSASSSFSRAMCISASMSRICGRVRMRSR